MKWTKRPGCSDQISDTGARIWKCVGRWYAEEANGDIHWGEHNRGFATIREAKAQIGTKA